MIIASKSSTDISQLRERQKLGVRFVELQLFERDVINTSKFTQIIDNILQTNLEVVAVHTPIKDEYTIESLATDKGFNMIRNTCALSDEISKITGKTIHVIVHFETRLDRMKNWGIFETIAVKIKELLEEYENIIINIENLTILFDEDGILVPRAGYLLDNVDICKELKKRLKTKRIGTVLDTCHAISSIRYIEAFKIKDIKKINIKKYFRGNKGYLNIVHLANAVGYGNGEGHAAGFYTEHDIELLEEMLGYLKEIDYKGIVSIEVMEKDYLNCVVFEDTFQKINKILKDL